jgi:tetratricopeptide (TPR) repeat protein
LFELGQCYFALKLPDEAIAPLKRSAEVDLDFAQAHFVLGRAFRMLGRSQEANQEQNLCRQIQAKEHAQPTPAK